ncbi:MAG: hypothetical protein V7637_1787, partial [Mycobacteriales bacterium]
MPSHQRGGPARAASWGRVGRVRPGRQKVMRLQDLLATMGWVIA